MNCKPFSNSVLDHQLYYDHTTCNHVDTMVEVTTDHLMPTAESTAASSMPPDVHSQPNIGSNSPGTAHSYPGVVHFSKNEDV